MSLPQPLPQPLPQLLAQLLDELERHNIRLWLEDGQLRFKAPAGAMTADRKARVRAHRQALIDRLAADDGPAAPVLRADPDNRHAPFPQTPIQQAYLVGRSDALDLGGVAANSYIEFERAGVDVARAEDCLNRVIARHPMLRTVLRPGGRQVVLETVPTYRIPVTDLTGLPEAERDARIAALRREIGERIRDPQRWPLFDLHWTRDGDRVRLHSCVDLIALDAWSSQLFFREWFALLDGRPEPPPPALTFRDVVMATQGAGAEAGRARAWTYWNAALPKLPPAPRLPAPRPGTGGDAGRGRFTRFHGHLPKARWQSWKRVCRARGVTPTSALATVFANVLSRWSRNEDVALNVTLFNRPPLHPDITRVLGEFTNTTLLGFDGMDRPLAEQAARTQTALLERLEHGAVAGVDLLRELARLRGDFSGSLMPVVFTSLLIGDDADAVGGLGWTQVHGVSQTPQVALDHQLYEERGGLGFNWDAAGAALDLDAVGAAFAAYTQALEALADDETLWDRAPDRRPPPAQMAVRDALHRPDPAAAPPPGGLADAFWDNLPRTAGADALLWSGGRLTHGELARHAAGLARRLRDAGVRPGDRVAVQLGKGPLQAVAVLAALHAGAAYVPVAPDLPAARVAAMLEQARPAARIVAADGARPAGDGIPALPVSLSDPLPDTSLAELAAQRAPTAPGDVAYVIFTSGSTGIPKGVTLTHGAVRNTLDDMAARFGMGPGDRVLALSALNFDLSVYDLFAPLAAGAALVIPDPGQERNPEHWHRLMTAHGVTVWNSVPTLLDMLLAWLGGGGGAGAASPAPSDAAPPVTLRLALVSGDWVPLGLCARLRALAPAARLVALGGATEAAIWSNWQAVDAVPGHWISVPYGLPLRHQRYRVLDRHGADRPDLVPGQLHIGGLGLASGYWGDPERTAAAFVEAPDGGGRLYRTGDLGRFWPDGTLEFLGREDGQVKLGGHRIELGEITHALERHPAVERAAALVQGGTDARGGAARLVAHVARTDGAAPTEAELRAHCRALLPAYMVPRRILVHAALPLSANGKIDPRALADLPPDPAGAGTGAAEPPTSLPTSLPGGPRAALRDILVQAVGGRTLPPDAGFFELGATSLTLVEAHARIRNELGIDLHVTDLFVHTSLAALEAHIRTLPPPTPLPGPPPPSPSSDTAR
ncbi:amino acid adenylation domain-containing protein [Azospirillum agricola]|uniref:non-ribosomal peptide synthetase n=1 Tax=Azospirillum agricola TaxID=1720247 RepID=UPI001AE3A26E|nr:non-ribosomal peptide synthetase [Azospirillum agricola]MBP2231644.1 amino acid adenylation domain-containing protein [Azospirillum agricola]